MHNSKTKIAIWIGGMAVGAIAGALLYQNKSKLAPQKENVSKIIGYLQKIGLGIGRRMKTI